MGCTVVEHPILKDRCLHSVLWSETGDTSSVEGSLDTEEHPAKHNTTKEVTERKYQSF